MKNILIATIFITVISSVIWAQKASQKNYCSTEDLGKQYDFRGQSYYGSFAPGDTCRIKAILYSNNNIRITVCSDPKLGKIPFKVSRTIREYKRVIEKIVNRETEIPIYKTDKNGNPIAIRDDWGRPKKDEFGDVEFVTLGYKTIMKPDTVWRTNRKTSEEILFDSRSNGSVFDTKFKTTESIEIIFFVPPSSNPSLKTYKGRVGLMIGRIFNPS